MCTNRHGCTLFPPVVLLAAWQMVNIQIESKSLRISSFCSRYPAANIPSSPTRKAQDTRRRVGQYISS